MDTIANVNWLTSWSDFSIQCPKGFAKMATMDWTFINKMVLVASQAINFQWFCPNLMVWNKPRWSNSPFWLKKMLNFPKIKNTNPSNLVLPHNPITLLFINHSKKCFVVVSTLMPFIIHPMVFTTYSSPKEKKKKENYGWHPLRQPQHPSWCPLSSTCCPYPSYIMWPF